jgi:alanine racemase
VLPVLAPRVDGLAVATASEAMRLRLLGFEKPLLAFFSVLGFVDPAEGREALAELVASGTTLTVTSLDEARYLAEAVRSLPRAAQVHLKIDTGMARGGVWYEEAPELLAWLRRAETLEITGAYTHFATADEVDDGFVAEQLARFRRVLALGGGADDLVLHAANSAALLEHPESHLDLVRPGLAVFGVRPAPHLGRSATLTPALRLRARLMAVKDVPAGTSASYGHVYTFARAARVGLVPVGYGDGYLFALGNRGTVRVLGADAPIRGRVTMDQIIVELTDIPEAAVGDDVEILSARELDPHSAVGLAARAGTIPYEILTRLGPRVRRVLVA